MKSRYDSLCHQGPQWVSQEPGRHYVKWDLTGSRSSILVTQMSFYMGAYNALLEKLTLKIYVFRVEACLHTADCLGSWAKLSISKALASSWGRKLSRCPNVLPQLISLQSVPWIDLKYPFVQIHLILRLVQVPQWSPLSYRAYCVSQAPITRSRSEFGASLAHFYLYLLNIIMDSGPDPT